MSELRRSFRPEFLNRLDEIIMFKPLTRSDLDSIIDLLVESLRKRLADQSLDLRLTDEAKALIIERGFDPLYGARPVKRVIQREVVNALSKRILAGEVDREKVIKVDANGEEIVFSN